MNRSASPVRQVNRDRSRPKDKKKKKVNLSTADVESLVPDVARRTVLVQTSNVTDPYTSAYAYQPHDLLSLQAVIAHSDFDMLRERTSGVACVQILFGGQENKGGFGSVTVVFPFTRGRLHRFAKDFTWPELEAVERLMLPVGRAIPFDSCPDVQPGDAKQSNDCFTDQKTNKTEPMRMDGPALIPGVESYFKASRSETRRLIIELYRTPSLASKVIIVKKLSINLQKKKFNPVWTLPHHYHTPFATIVLP